MATYQQSGGGSGSGSTIGRGASRALSSALRSAARSTDSGESMDLDGGLGRAGRGGHRRTGARSAGPLDQTGRHRPPKESPYTKPTAAGRSLSSRISGPPGSSGSSTRPKRGATNINPRRNPEGTPDVLNDRNPRRQQVQQQQHSKFNEVLKTDGFKAWLQSRLIAPGVLDMSNLNEDLYLKEQGILPPGDKDAPTNVGHVLWKMASNVLETPTDRIHTLSLARNGFRSLHQLQRLPICLPYIRALDLSDNPVPKSDELKHLQSAGEQRGKASTGIGSLKSLVELKLNGVKFREEYLTQPKGAEAYQHDVLRRFPGLLILDGVQLNRIVFPVTRKPVVRRIEAERKQLLARPFSFPFDVAGSFEENEGCRATAMNFCQMFFLLWDTDRNEIVHAYHPEATVSIAANTLPSRSFQATEVSRSRSTRPQPVSFESWVNLPGRNFLRSCTTIEQRTNTLKSPMDMPEFVRWLTKSVPKTKHPLEDASKWCIDAWYFDETQERISVVIQAEFQELPSGTYRSFTRTFILGAAPHGSLAAAKSWPCIVLSDVMVVHSYLGTGSWDSKSSLASGDTTIVPPAEPNTAAPASDAQQAVLIEQCRLRTGMNATYSAMCLAQNGWDLERAVVNFGEIRSSIPAEAFTQ